MPSDLRCPAQDCGRSISRVAPTPCGCRAALWRRRITHYQSCWRHWSPECDRPSLVQDLIDQAPRCRSVCASRHGRPCRMLHPSDISRELSQACPLHLLQQADDSRQLLPVRGLAFSNSITCGWESVASPPSSAIVLTPAALSFKASIRPSSSSRHAGMSALALSLRTRPNAISFCATCLKAAPSSSFDTTRQRSLRSYAPEDQILCATKGDGHDDPPGAPDNPGLSPGKAPDRLNDQGQVMRADQPLPIAMLGSDTKASHLCRESGQCRKACRVAN